MKKNVRLAFLLSVVGLGMLGFGYALVPFYRIFCDFVGIPVPKIVVGREGIPKVSTVSGTQESDRYVTIRFMANSAQDMPVQLQPVIRKMRVKLGEPVLTAYQAENPHKAQIWGTAVHTIVPMGSKFGTNIDEYVDLQQCFCFEEQLYPAREEVNLPLNFFVTPDLPEGIHTITFAYTLYALEEKSGPSG